MNLSLLERSQLEALVLHPPRAAQHPPRCSENSVLDHFPPPRGERDTRLRHVLYAAHELLTRIAAESIKGRCAITHPQLMRDFFRVYFAGCQREEFAVVYLDATHRVIDTELLFAGTLTHTAVFPREVVRRALQFNAAALCFGHNHPSGDPSPSRADEHLTGTLRQALALIDVRVLDHIIVGVDSAVSMAERGLI